MYSLLIVDDETEIREGLLSFDFRLLGIGRVKACENGLRALEMLDNESFDLIISDIRMPFMDGLTLSQQIAKKYPEMKVIILSGYSDFEYARKCISNGVVDYLLKPIGKERFDKAIQKWLQQASKPVPQPESLISTNVYEGYQHRIVVKDNGLIRIIPAQDIHYIEANDDYNKIVTKDGSYLKKSTLSNVEQSFDPQQFIRVHRSYLIPVSQLLRIEPYEKESHIALLQCGAKVLVSKTGMTKLKTILGW